ncbi:hypothetical protein LCGC14_0839930 [marine sediment metagenome]|uniref:Uncharacterized protein n=1 Tax=marine sediment metagenome TaxID=412755 RepID=A0A0F9PDF8_9ZZZZ
MTDTPFIAVDWIDTAVLTIEQMTQEQASKETPKQARTLGWLLKEDDTKIVLASTRFEDEQEFYYRDIMIIPSQSVLGMALLSYTQPRNEDLPT